VLCPEVTDNKARRNEPFKLSYQYDNSIEGALQLEHPADYYNDPLEHLQVSGPHDDADYLGTNACPSLFLHDRAAIDSHRLFCGASQQRHPTVLQPVESGEQAFEGPQRCQQLRE
jgi:hypothetical protein